MEIKPTRPSLSRPAYWLGLIALLALFHANHPLDLDEGVVLNGAWHLLNGKELYVDWFEFTTPGSFYVVFWAWKLFGPSYAVAKGLGVAAVFLAAIGIFRTSRLFIVGPATYIPPLLFCFMSIQWAIINHNTFNVALLIWATYFAAKSCTTRSSADVVASGLFTGIAILFLQHKGGGVLLAIALAFLFQHAREKQAGWARHAALYLIFSLLPLAVLFAWPLPTLYENLIHFPLFRYTRINWVTPYALLAAAISTILVFRVLRESRERAVGLLAVIQTVLLLTTLQRPDPYHVALALYPLLILLPLAFDKLSHATSLSDAIYALLVGTAVALYFAAAALLLPAQQLLVLFDGHQDEELPAIRYVKQSCSSSYLYAGPFLPGIYYETRKLNPLPFPSLFTNYHTEEQFLIARQMLEKAAPDCAVLFYTLSVHEFGYSTENPVDRFILERYSHVLTDGQVLVYRKNP